jgi:hypothetical protein
MAMAPSTTIQEQAMTTFRKLSAAALTITVLATSTLATSGDALAKGKHRAPKFGGNPMAMMMGGGGGGNPMAMLAKNPMMMMMAMMMMSKMAGGGGPMGGGSPMGGGFPSSPMGPMAMFGGSPFGQ